LSRILMRDPLNLAPAIAFTSTPTTAPPTPHAVRNHAAARALRAIEHGFDQVFGAAANPLRQLGALALMAFFIALASGAYLYVAFDTSAAGAHRSIEALSTGQPWLGGIVRSLHRYSADSFALLTVLHLVREWTHGRYHGFRWFSWLTGVPLLLLLTASGMVGYWLVADTRAQFVATAIGEWVGWLPGFGDALVRNFVTAEALSDRLFSLLVFLHIGLGLLLLLGSWVHLLRLVRPQVFVARTTAWGMAVLLLALCLVAPAASTAPADSAQTPRDLPIDWFYLAPLALAQAASPALSWIAVGAVSLILALLPWTRRAPRPAPVIVDPVNCNGCARCFADCPYGAVVMAPRTDARNYKSIAVVDPDLCAACGICVGACPSSTPFRSSEILRTGIDLPWRPIDQLRARLSAELAHRPGAIVVLGCDWGADVSAARANDVIQLSTPCLAYVPPSFAEYALRLGARAVLFAGCGEHECEFRFGSRFAAERLRGEREPHLRTHARGPRVVQVDAGRGQQAHIAAALAALRKVPQGQLDAVA
jgi:ferredoxin/coenzyme F420-reducing hydrogenase delta subunit